MQAFLAVLAVLEKDPEILNQFLALITALVQKNPQALTQIAQAVTQPKP